MLFLNVTEQNMFQSHSESVIAKTENTDATMGWILIW